MEIELFAQRYPFADDFPVYRYAGISRVEAEVRRSANVFALPRRMAPERRTASSRCRILLRRTTNEWIDPALTESPPPFPYRTQKRLGMEFQDLLEGSRTKAAAAAFSFLEGAL